MAKTQTVTISLEEYKELLLKDKPSSSDHEMVERIFNEIQKHLTYSSRSSGPKLSGSISSRVHSL